MIYHISPMLYSYRNKSIDNLLYKSIDWFPYDCKMVLIWNYAVKTASLKNFRIFHFRKNETFSTSKLKIFLGEGYFPDTSK